MAWNPLQNARPAKIVHVALEDIDPNPAQPRRRFDPQGIRELADSIAENGLICPISLRKVGRRYEMIAGERRLMAFRLLGERTIPAIIEQADEHRSAAMALVENLQRQGLSFFEEALAIAGLIEANHLTQREAADKLGLAQATVANKLRLLRLPPETLKRLVDAGCTERHARALVGIDDAQLLDAAVTRIIRSGLNVAQTERMVAELLAPKTHRGTRLLIIKDLRLFTSTINRAVEVMKQAGIDADTKKTEDEERITFTIVIPKTKERQRTPQRA